MLHAVLSLDTAAVPPQPPYELHHAPLLAAAPEDTPQLLPEFHQPDESEFDDDDVLEPQLFAQDELEFCVVEVEAASFPKKLENQLPPVEDEAALEDDEELPPV